MFFSWFVICIERIFAMVYNVHHSHHCSSCNLQKNKKIQFTWQKLHVVNFNDVASSLAFEGCDSNSSIENLQPMNEGPQ
jgi:hypothetical protein